MNLSWPGVSWEWGFKRYHFSLGIWSPILSMFIIAVRAFSPSALPIEEWSLLSWFWMTLPMTWWIIVLLIIKPIGFLFSLFE